MIEVVIVAGREQLVPFRKTYFYIDILRGLHFSMIIFFKF